MTIIEQSLTPKNPRKKSEDGIVITNDFIAVIDGSTSKASHQWSRRQSNGRYAMTIVSRVIRSMPADTSCHQFCVRATKAIRNVYLPFWKITGRQSVAEALALHPEERLCASAVVYSCRRRELWLVGDCQCLVGGKLFENPKPYELRLAEHRAERVRQLMAEGMTANELLTDDQARAAIIPEMLQEMKNQNKTYAVIDGFPIPEVHVPIITLDFRPWEIVLATDGYPFLCATLKESEERLAAQRRDDPLNIDRFKATKGFTPGNNSFDDRTYVRFTV